MMQITPKSVVLNYVILIAVQLKWACDFLLYQSFFQHYPSLQYNMNDFLYETSSLDDNCDDHDHDHDVECSVCLCKIEEGDEVSELRCRHLYHKACLDRWLGYGHVTCPLCRNHVKAPPQFVAELHQELIVVNIAASMSRDDRSMWWLR